MTLLDMLWWLQPAVTGGGGGGGGAAPGGGAAAGGGDMGCAMQAGLFAVMLAVFYFVLIRPEQKRRKEHEEMQRSLRKGMSVRTTGGILGEIVSVQEGSAVLQIADRVRINVLLSHVSAVEGADARASAPERDRDKKKKKDDADEGAEKKSGSASDASRDEA